MQSDDPYEELLPEPFINMIDEFDKLVLIKMLRPEKLMFGFSSYVNNNIGHYYLEVP